MAVPRGLYPLTAEVTAIVRRAAGSTAGCACSSPYFRRPGHSGKRRPASALISALFARLVPEGRNAPTTTPTIPRGPDDAGAHQAALTHLNLAFHPGHRRSAGAWHLAGASICLSIARDATSASRRHGARRKHGGEPGRQRRALAAVALPRGQPAPSPLAVGPMSGMRRSPTLVRCRRRRSDLRSRRRWRRCCRYFLFFATERFQHVVAHPRLAGTGRALLPALALRSPPARG